MGTHIDPSSPFSSARSTYLANLLPVLVLLVVRHLDNI